MNKYNIITGLSLMGLLSACAGPGPGSIELGTDVAALKTMETVTANANRCWFKTGQKEFKGYRLAPELQSFSGRPRMLVVPAHNPGGRPALVIEAEGSPSRVTVYGPMMAEPVGNKIADSVDRWTKGDDQC